MQSSIKLIISSGLTLLLVTGFSVLTAYRLGPSEFGLFAAMQAVAVVLMPLASLRLETRVALCKTDAELDDLGTAITSTGAVFLLLSGAFVLCLWILGRPLAYGFVALQTVGMVVADFGLARLAFRRLHGPLALYRFLRQFVPVGLALIAAWWYPHHQHAMAALVLGTWIWALILGWPGSYKGLWQWSVFKAVWKQHNHGLKASVVLGGLNGLWLNGLQPLMAWLGWHQLAGQYALLQRLINAPLTVLTVVVNSLLLAKGNDLHERRALLVQVCAGLALLGMTWSACLWGLLFVQPYWPVPAHWLPEQDFFYAAAVFGVGSFAVGTVSVVSIRLRDEWFVAGWQLLFMLVWVLALFVSDLNHVFSGLLIMGGLAYVVLLWRWIILIPAKDV